MPITGTEFNDELLGSADADALDGGDGDDTLLADVGDDTLDGGAGNDTLSGDAGADRMTGGDGDDVYDVDDAGDLVVELAAQGFDTVRASISHTLAAHVEALVLTGGADLAGTGNDLDNSLTGNDGANTLDGGLGADAMDGGLGDDTYVVDQAGDGVLEAADAGIDTVRAAVSHALADNVEKLVLLGAAALNGTGNALDNEITGNGAANALDGGLGADTMAGGAGNDVYTVDAEGDVVVETDGGGVDEVRASATHSLGAFVETLTLTGTAGIDGTGNALANKIVGNAGANRLDGGGGIDDMAGGLGDDTYVVDHASDKVTEAASAGTDTVETTVTLALAANVENLTLAGAAAINGTGNAAANVITGNAARNLLDGGLGADTLSGGDGDDVYAVGEVGDRVIEAADDGIDLVRAAVSYTLGDHVEKLLLTGTTDLNGTGNALDNTLTGNAGRNRLEGGAGADTLAGGLGDDTYVVDAEDTIVEASRAGFDKVQSSVSLTLALNVEDLTLTGSADLNGTGNELVNKLTGNGGRNRLDGGLGADILTGGAGDDVYVVDNSADRIVEDATGGIDTVVASTHWVLREHTENLELTGVANLTARGNALANAITGNAGANQIDGGLGADTMAGGAGDDLYLVDQAGDRVIEAAAAGIDTVRSTISYTLGDDVEHLALAGTASLTGTGNALANRIQGNGGANLLDGGLGADTLLGGTGDDVYVVGDAGDVVTEALGQGRDLVRASVAVTLARNVEDLLLEGADALSGTGNELANALTGNAADNALAGAAGDDVLEGGLGDDALDGGLGSDTASYAGAAGGVTVDLAAGATQDTGAAGRDSFTSIENLAGSAYGDALSGDDLANTLKGLGGDDTLLGGGGDDRLDGGAGDDQLDGGDGIDTVSYASALIDLTVRLGEAGAQDMGADGHDALINIENLEGGAGNDALYGDDGANLLLGGAGNDALDGGGAADDLRGGAGNDTLLGGAGADVLLGGAGADRLVGGDGADRFVFSAAGDSTIALTGRDTIVGFSRAGGDKIDLHEIDANARLAGDQAMTYIGSTTFYGRAGQLRFANGILEGDLNGDRRADFAVSVEGMSAMLGSDFLL